MHALQLSGSRAKGLLPRTKLGRKERWSSEDHLLRISWHLFRNCTELCGQVWLLFIPAARSQASTLFSNFM